MKFIAIRKRNNKPVLNGAVFIGNASMFTKGKGKGRGILPKSNLVDCEIKGQQPLISHGKTIQRQLFTRHFWFFEHKGETK